MTNREDIIPVVVLTFVVTFAATMFVGVLAMKSERKQLQNEAIKRNYAEWVNDGEGNPVFTWKEPAQ